VPAIHYIFFAYKRHSKKRSNLLAKKDAISIRAKRSGVAFPKGSSVRNIGFKKPCAGSSQKNKIHLKKIQKTDSNFF